MQVPKNRRGPISHSELNFLCAFCQNLPVQPLHPAKKTTPQHKSHKVLCGWLDLAFSRQGSGEAVDKADQVRLATHLAAQARTPPFSQERTPKLKLKTVNGGNTVKKERVWLMWRSKWGKCDVPVKSCKTNRSKAKLSQGLDEKWTW